MASLFVRRVLPLLLLGTLGLSSCVTTYRRGYYAPGPPPPPRHHHGYYRPGPPPPGPGRW